MKNYFIYSLLALVLVACNTPTYVNPGDISYTFSNNEKKALPSDASIMVVGIQQSNSIVLMVEQALLARGMKLIADPEIQLRVPVTQTQRVANDTTVLRTQIEPRVREIYPPKPADYIVRYRYTGDKRTLSAFNANVISRETGEVISTFSYNCRSSRFPRTQIILDRFAKTIFRRYDNSIPTED
jgi:hypothetical protein